MKLIIALLAFGLSGACATSPSRSDEQATAMRVMTFNVRYDNPQDGADAWPHRRGHVASLIAFHDPDVIGLQEVLLHQRDHLAEISQGFARLTGEMIRCTHDGAINEQTSASTIS